MHKEPLSYKEDSIIFDNYCLEGGTKLDERVIRTDLDPGFIEGRQYGRGKSGGQVRDEYREEYDEGRGGLGRAIQAERLKEEEEYGKGR